jgi:hypothetical protein
MQLNFDFSVAFVKAFLELSDFGTGKPVFEDVLHLLKHLRNEMSDAIVHSIILTTHFKLEAYANLK